MKARSLKPTDTSFTCLHCNEVADLDMTIEEYFHRRKGKRVMRKIEVDAEGYSRKWLGVNQSQGKRILRADGDGHPHITCQRCSKANVFGREYYGDIAIWQVLGRSETDLRYLKEREREDHPEADHRLDGKADPAEDGLAGDVRPR